MVGRTNRRALLRGARSTATANDGGAKPGGGATSGDGAAPRDGATSGHSARPASPLVIAVRDRAEATRWVREHLVDGDVVLYENDLPDHYP